MSRHLERLDAFYQDKPGHFHLLNLYLSWAYTGVLPLYLFPVFFACSLVGCLIGTYVTRPTADETLMRFYSTVRPWGFWTKW